MFVCQLVLLQAYKRPSLFTFSIHGFGLCTNWLFGFFICRYPNNFFSYGLNFLNRSLADLNNFLAVWLPLSRLALIRRLFLPGASWLGDSKSAIIRPSAVAKSGCIMR